MGNNYLCYIHYPLLMIQVYILSMIIDLEQIDNWTNNIAVDTLRMNKEVYSLQSNILVVHVIIKE